MTPFWRNNDVIITWCVCWDRVRYKTTGNPEVRRGGECGMMTPGWWPSRPLQIWFKFLRMTVLYAVLVSFPRVIERLDIFIIINIIIIIIIIIATHNKTGYCLTLYFFWFESLLAENMDRVILIHHDDVIIWKHFPRYWPFVRGIHRQPVNSPHKGQWRGALMFSLICVLDKRLSKQS